MLHDVTLDLVWAAQRRYWVAVLDLEMKFFMPEELSQRATIFLSRRRWISAEVLKKLALGIKKVFHDH